MLQVYEKEDITCVEMTAQKMSKVFAFLVDGMLIDTGAQRFESELIPFYEDVSFDLVALTHSHEDHTGTAPWIQDNRDVPFYIHSKGIDICSQSVPYPKYRQNTWGARKEFKALPIKDTIQSREKEWKVIDTPGHADDHVSLFNEETGTLFSGDLFVTPKTKVIMRSESIPQIMDSIRTVLTYDFGAMFCCHAGYIQDGKVKMKQKLEYLENLYGEVKNLHEKGLLVEEIDERLFPKKYSITFVSEGEWDSLHIVSSICLGLRAVH
ncbi:MBL fold metallo-hydrolase [Filibacter tadaridae]|uniref:Putative metallo-hydrolase YflN n=1 Tax=Filibacter tadaridae TaxID=2483811 RepID=A0A3P5WTH5_9BACL|nr:MBL fold metallo-hydrolase [Filibacter tadaridae]VDC22490.1 putative metallo-hydrolase YflN [Filibacter tadaridae]